MRVSWPPTTPSAPAPPITPLKVVEALVKKRGFAPRFTEPSPDRVTIAAPALVAAMSNTPWSMTFDETAIDPDPLKLSWAPDAMVVTPE